MLPFLTQPALSACDVPRPESALSHSLLFRGSQYLWRTMAQGNPRKFTIQGWFYRGPENGQEQVLVDAGVLSGVHDSVSHDSRLSFLSTGQVRLFLSRSGANSYYHFTTTGKFRTPGWYAIKATVDTNNKCECQRLRIEVNGQRQDGSGSWPEQGYAELFFNGPYAHRIGCHVEANASPFYGYAANVLMTEAEIDAVETNIHGVVVPRPAAELHAAIAAKNGWGVNGCHLDFADPLNPGQDASGQGRHWTAVGLNANGKSVVSNTPTDACATFNPLSANLTYSTVSKGNTFLRQRTDTQSSYAVSASAFLTLPACGKVYFEVTTTGTFNNGVGGLQRHPYLWIGENQYLDGTPGTWRVAIDGTAGKAWLAKGSGAWVGGGDPVSGASPTMTFQGTVYPCMSAFYGTGSYGTFDCQLEINTGQSAWAFGPPAGFGRYSTGTLPEPVVKDPAAGYACVAGGADVADKLDVFSWGWNGGWVEIVKRRDAAEHWRVRFSDDPANAWSTSNTDAKAAVQALASGGDYVGMRLRLGKAYGVHAVEVTHAGGRATKVRHGLGTARNMVVATRVSAGGGDRWVRHPDLEAGRLFKLNSAGVFAVSTLTNFGPDDFDIDANAPAGVYRVLVLAERPGFISLGRYTGNGSADGQFVRADLSPSLFLAKDTVVGSTANWVLSLAELTDGHNPMATLFPNSTAMESAGAVLDLSIGGVKHRQGSADPNLSGRDYCALQIGRSVGGACVAPATAR